MPALGNGAPRPSRLIEALSARPQETIRFRFLRRGYTLRSSLCQAGRSYFLSLFGLFYSV